MFTRREVAGLLGLLALSRTTLGSDYASPHNPFSLGVASGDPGSASVVLWTRLAPHLTGGEQLEPQPIAVSWELARDPLFRRLESRGRVTALPELSHSVHVDVDGLEPGTSYFYRFTAGNHTSQAGRTCTLPDYASANLAARLNFVTASCQDYTQGYFNAFEHIARDDLDFVIHLGDYIYDWPNAPGARWGSKDFIRRHCVGSARTLDDFRQLHGQYKLDKSLQQAHAAHPWFVIPDNHDGIEDATAPSERKSAAFQAYYEHMPVRLASRPDPEAYTMHRHFVSDVGELARFVFLDTRQFRDSQAACGAGRSEPIQGSVNPSIQPGCADLEVPGRTMLGQAQLAFLLDALSNSRARWNFIVSTCVMAPYDFDPPHNVRYLFGWDGYPAERAKILSHLGRRAIANPVVLSGDWHSFWVNDLMASGDPVSSAVAVEFATSGVTSRYPGNATLMRNSLEANRQVRYLNTEDRGYMRFSLTSTRLTAACIAVDCKIPGGAPPSEVARFDVGDSSPGPD